MRRRTALFVAPIAAIALIGAGCGGGDSTTGTTGNSGGGSNDPVALLNGIKVPSTQSEPTKVVMKITSNLKGTISDPQVAAFLGDGPVGLEISGPTDPAKKSADLAFAAKAGKINLKGNLRMVDGTKSFIQLNNKWYSLPEDSLKQSTGGNDVSQITDALKSVKPADLVKNPQYKGSEDIEGRSTEHVSGDVDTAGLVKTVADIAQSQTTTTIDTTKLAEAQQKIDQYIKNATVDVWIDKDTQEVRRLQLKGDFVADADMKKSSGLDGASIDILVQGTPTSAPNVEAPAGALSSEQLQSELSTILLSSLGG